MENNENKKRLRVIEVSKGKKYQSYLTGGILADAILLGIVALGKYLGYNYLDDLMWTEFIRNKVVFELGAFSAIGFMYKKSNNVYIEENEEKGRSL